MQKVYENEDYIINFVLEEPISTREDKKSTTVFVVKDKKTNEEYKVVYKLGYLFGQFTIREKDGKIAITTKLNTSNIERDYFRNEYFREGEFLERPEQFLDLLTFHFLSETTKADTITLYNNKNLLYKGLYELFIDFIKKKPKNVNDIVFRKLMFDKFKELNVDFRRDINDNYVILSRKKGVMRTDVFVEVLTFLPEFEASIEFKVQFSAKNRSLSSLGKDFEIFPGTNTYYKESLINPKKSLKEKFEILNKLLLSKENFDLKNPESVLIGVYFRGENVDFNPLELTKRLIKNPNAQYISTIVPIYNLLFSQVFYKAITIDNTEKFFVYTTLQIPC